MSVFNFWEPLHYLDRGYGFQTWEVSPVYAIRSWAYIILYLLPARIPALLLGPNKVSYKKNYSERTTFLYKNHQRPAFFGVRITLAVASAFCEANLHRAVITKVNERVGRYLFFMLLASAGMWNASTGTLSSPQVEILSLIPNQHSSLRHLLCIQVLWHSLSRFHRLVSIMVAVLYCPHFSSLLVRLWDGHSLSLYQSHSSLRSSVYLE